MLVSLQSAEGATSHPSGLAGHRRELLRRRPHLAKGGCRIRRSRLSGGEKCRAMSRGAPEATIPEVAQNRLCRRLLSGGLIVPPKPPRRGEFS